MKRSTPGLTMALLLLATAFAAPLASIARGSNNSPTADTTIVGYISDAMCGAKHMSGMGDDWSCTLACVDQGNKLVLADRDHKRIYQLDQAGQQKARDFAGQKVKVTGRLSGRTIRVTSIQAAS